MLVEQFVSLPKALSATGLCCCTMCGSRVSSGSGGKGSGPERAAWISALQGLVKSSIVIPFVGDAGEERLLPETEPGMTFTIVWCTDRVLARIS